MPFMSALTDAIANPTRVRASQERASERRYAGRERKMGAVSNISPEAVLSPSSDSISSTSSRPPSRERSSPPRVRRPEFQRSQSEAPILSQPLPRPKPVFTPCITAMDLTSEQLKKTYSSDDLQGWDRSKYPLPPLCPMRGNFRYRTAATADPEWRQQYFKKQIHGLDGLNCMIAELDMKDMTGLSDDEWQTLAEGGSRRGSAVSSIDTRTASTRSLQDAPTIDRSTGVRVLRGFSPSRSSSVRSSFHSRKGSTLSVMNFASEAEASRFQKPVQRQNTLPDAERRPSGPLSTIKELQITGPSPTEMVKRIARPCEFADNGDPDSAVASDVEDDEGAWSDVVETQPSRVSALTQMLKEGRRSEPQGTLTRVRTTSSEKKRDWSSTTSIDRSKTIRANKPQSHRRRSRTKSTTHDKVKSDDAIGKSQILPLPTPESVEDDSPVLTMNIQTVFKPPNYQRPQPVEPVRTNDDTLVAEKQLEFFPRGPRNWSASAVFCSNEVSPLTVNNAQQAV